MQNDKKLLLGDDAVAQAAIDAGLSGIYAYPGTPSTEIMEFVQKSPDARRRNIHRQWSANEKTAVEEALGLSYVGKRSMVCMKHVGLNVAADAFINAAMTGVNGGLILVVADDPSMHSSQNEQDSRFYGKFAMIPVFEPSCQQEAYDMVFEAYALSEKYAVPVMMRLTTRMAHSRSGVSRRALKDENLRSLPENPSRFILLPVNARRQYKNLLALQNRFSEESLHSVFNQYTDGPDKSIGIIACGIAYNYLLENFENHDCPYPVVKIAQYPVPAELIRTMSGTVKKILVLEEGYPFVEEQLNGIIANNYAVSGRLDGTLPRDGELSPDLAGKALGLTNRSFFPASDSTVPRPPALCRGCGHIDMFSCISEVMKEIPDGLVFSDIGCYTLGALPPFSAIVSCVDMGASITMAKGASDGGLPVAAAVIGDSTFTHSGMTGLLDCILEKTPVTIIIGDNSTAAMTGGQDSSAFGKIEKICLGLGVEEDHLQVLTSLKKFHQENMEKLKKELLYQGVSVVVFRRECVQVAARRARKV
jgi:indolepyruvate ferredoxin oxidoreductase alpha subunit